MKIKIKQILYLFLLNYGILLPVYGQDQIVDKESIQALFEKYNNTTDKDEKLAVGLEIVMKHISFSPDTVIKYGEESLQLARHANDIRAQVEALGFIGEANIYKGNLPRTLQLGLEALELQKSLNLKLNELEGPSIGPTYFNLVELYIQLQDYDKAMEYAREKIKFGKAEGSGHRGITTAFALYLTARVFEKNNQLDSAAIYVDRAYAAFQNVKKVLFGDVYDVYPKLYNVQASIFFKQQKPEEALKLLRKGLAVTIASGESLHSSDFNNDLARYFQEIQQVDSCIYYANQGINEAQKIGYAQGMLTAYKILAATYEDIDSNEALKYYKKANEAQNNLYGSGNIKVIKEMIAKNEQRNRDIELAEQKYRDQLTLYSLLLGLFFVLLFAYFQFRNNKKSKSANIILKKALDDLKSTQTQLIQSEKMASLGELTAGIAHEIQNPLNFVNNFSEVSGELVDELNKELVKGDSEEVKFISADLKENLLKINHHGLRASSIVKGMLEHSRKSTGKKELTDINALADEYLRLSYHGLRAKDKSFNADFETDFDPNLPEVKVIPQDMGRVLLNLINNAFQAVHEQAQKCIQDYKPSITVKTELTANSEVIIAIKDNGYGIPDEIKDKIFQPFFTTKDTGKGTGLGLSLAYDIVKAHGGELKVESKTAAGSTFTIYLPS